MPVFPISSVPGGVVRTRVWSAVRDFKFNHPIPGYPYPNLLVEQAAPKLSDIGWHKHPILAVFGYELALPYLSGALPYAGRSDRTPYWTGKEWLYYQGSVGEKALQIPPHEYDGKHDAAIEMA